MAPFIEWVNAVSQTWCDVMLAVLWQSTLLIIVAGVAVGLLLRRASPRWRFWLCQAVAIKLLVMPFWISTLPRPSFLHGLQGTAADRGEFPQADLSDGSLSPAGGATLADDIAESDLPAVDAASSRHRASSRGAPNVLQTAQAMDARLTAPAWLFLAWLAGVCGLMLRLLVQCNRLALLLKRAECCDDGGLPGLLRSACDRLAVRPMPRLLWSPFEWSPFVCGLWMPSLVLPRALQGQLTQSQWFQVLLHEAAHVKRRDLLWNWIPAIVRTVYFFHPAVHWLANRICLERELACDALTMTAAGTSAADYADTLVCVMSRTSAVTVPAVRDEKGAGDE